MHARFYAPGLDPGAPETTLPPDEGNHLARVMRLRTGDPVRLFDGCGHEFEGVVASIERDRVAVRIVQPAVPAAEPRIRLTLAQALLKGDAMDCVIRDAVMLGVSQVVPILSGRIETDRRASSAAARLDRWTRIAVSSAKQCGRAVVPPVLPPVRLSEWMDESATVCRVALVEPTVAWPAVPLEELRRAGAPQSAAILVGPEGGWTPEEAARMAAAGVIPVTLGARTLRAESAAIVGLTALHCAWGEFA